VQVRVRVRVRVMATLAEEWCWGALLQGICADACQAPLDRNCRHFKTKFCQKCRWAMAVPATRVRVLSDEMTCVLENRRSTGMWTTAPKRAGKFRFRVVNNTKDCRGRPLVIFEKPPPSCVPCEELDPELLDERGMVQLCVCKGTAVPIHHVKGRKRVEFPMREFASLPSSVTSSPAPSRASSPEPFDVPEPPPTACTVLVPSVLVKLANTTATPVALPLPRPEPRNRREHRMQRNRASAATSRERKRKYIAELEYQVDALERTVVQLRHENGFWRSLDIDRYDATCPLMVCEWFESTRAPY